MGSRQPESWVLHAAALACSGARPRVRPELSPAGALLWAPAPLSQARAEPRSEAQE